MKKQLAFFILVASIYTQVHAQKFSYDVDFITYFDNREYHSGLQPSQTIFGTRLSPEIGVIFNDSLGGTHKMMAGVSYIQPFGAQWQAAKFHHNRFLAGWYAQINHLANKSSDQPNFGVCNDSDINPFIGVDFSNKTPLDSLSLKLGYLVGMQRDRKQDSTYIPQEATIDLFARWRFLAIQSRLYFGDNLMPLYGTYGTLLNQGNAFYQSPIYNRNDLMIYIIQRPFVNC